MQLSKIIFWLGVYCLTIFGTGFAIAASQSVKDGSVNSSTNTCSVASTEVPHRIANTTNAPTATWSFHHSNGTSITLHGHATEIKTQLKVLDPEWTPRARSGKTNNVHAVRNKLEGRIDEGARDCCPVAGWGWKTCKFLDFVGAANALYELGSRVFLVQPQSCQVASTYYDCNIYVCNNDHWSDNAYEIYPLSIVDYAVIISECGSPEIGLPFCGQFFTNEPWDVIVHK